MIFEQDGTIAPSKQQTTRHIAELLAKLQHKVRVGIISGESIRLMEECVIELMPPEALSDRLFMLPVSGSALYTYADGERRELYCYPIAQADVRRIETAMLEAALETGVIDFTHLSHGDRIENRGSQITLSAFGQKAPLALKQRWDPDYAKRTLLRDAIAAKLPEFQVKWGGLTSVDVTLPGENKATGIRRLAEFLHLPVSEITYIGNSLFPGGHNEIVKETGVRVVEVDNQDDLVHLLDAVLSR